MGRILVAFIAAAVLMWIAYTQIKSDGPKSAPKQTLDKTRESVDRIGKDLQKQADKINQED